MHVDTTIVDFGSLGLGFGVADAQRTYYIRINSIR